MLFEEIKAKVLALKEPERGWAFSNKWLRLFYDEEKDVCYTGHKQWDADTRKHDRVTKLHDATLVIHPDNVAVYAKEIPDPDYMFLRTLTINGKIKKTATVKSHYTYIHDNLHQYECLGGMQLCMKTGKALNMRLLDDIPVNEEQRKKVLLTMKAMRANLLTVVRMDESKWNTDNARIRERFDDYASAVTLTEIINSYRGGEFEKKTWMQDVMQICRRFYTHNGVDDTSAENRIRQFDNMMRFHKALVFRQTGVIE